MGLLLTYSLIYADEQLIIAEEYEDTGYMTRKLIEELRKWGKNVTLEKTRYMIIGAESKYLILENGKGIIYHCNGNLEDDINLK